MCTQVCALYISYREVTEYIENQFDKFLEAEQCVHRYVHTYHIERSLSTLRTRLTSLKFLEAEQLVHS